MKKRKVPLFTEWQDERRASGMHRCINGQVCYPGMSLDCIKCYEADMTDLVEKISEGK